MNNLYKAFILITAANIVSACTTLDPNIGNVGLHTNQAYQPAMAANISEKEQVLGIVREFATKIACSTSFDDDAEQNITTIDDVFLVGDSDYLVYWNGDIGCSGGVVDNSSFMTSVNRISSTRPFLIETGFGNDSIRHDKFFSDLGIYPRFVSDVFYRKGTFSIVSWHDNGDGTNGWLGNAPRYKYRYLVKGGAQDGWRVIAKKLLVDRKINSEDF